MVKISVIIPVYNMENYLRRCLDSLLITKITNMEVLLVNDGSTDTSEHIIEEYVQKYPNIFKKFNKPNGGQATARNLGLKNALRRIRYIYR